MKSPILLIVVLFIVPAALSSNEIFEDMVRLYRLSTKREEAMKMNDDEAFKLFYGDEIQRLQTDPKPRNVEQVVLGNPVVETTSGVVTGVTLEQSHAFYSIPFAQPPVGDLRFKAPLPYDGAGTNIDGTTRQDIACSQLRLSCVGETLDTKIDNVTTTAECDYRLVEDCLYLNVFSPTQVDLSNSETNPDNLLPVMVYIHGGFFLTGSSNSPVHEERWLTQKTNTVNVIINYRLGALGFLAYDDGVNKISGHQGLQDQQMALMWVRDNIRSFGGNPDQVTIFGESAGSQAVMFHLLSAASEPYFQRAIMESNPAMFKYPTPEQAHVVTKRLTEFMGCQVGTEYDCLMTSSAIDIYKPEWRIRFNSYLEDLDLYTLVEPYRPVIDGVEFTDQPMDCFRDGKWQRHKSFAIGTNTEELDILPAFMPFPFPYQIYSLMNKLLFGEEMGAAVTQRYDDEYGGIFTLNYAQIFGYEMTDFFFICPTRALARMASTTMAADGGVYYYSNSYPQTGQSCIDYQTVDGMCGFAFHAAELLYVFSTGPYAGYNFDETDNAVADMFSSYWGDFAYSDYPISGVDSSLGSHVKWPLYTSQSVNGNEPWTNLLIKSPESSVETKYEENLCNFWDSFNFYVDMSVTNTRSSNYRSNPRPEESAKGSTGSSKLLSANLYLILFSLSMLRFI